MYFIGDIHGKTNEYKMLLKEFGEEPSIQLGDFGFGFSKNINAIEMPAQHKFIRGNHDNPAIARTHPNYLGEFGYLKDSGIFFISGGLSVDKMWRVPGLSWWFDEQLSTKQMEECEALYNQIKPGVVASHECPEFLIKSIYTNAMKLSIPSVTAQLLERLWHSHQPGIWVFGHHHVTKRIQVENTHFIALEELGTAEIA